MYLQEIKDGDGGVEGDRTSHFLPKPYLDFQLVVIKDDDTSKDLS